MSLRSFLAALILAMALGAVAGVLINVFHASPEVAGLVFVIGSGVAALLGVRVLERERERRGLGPSH